MELKQEIGARLAICRTHLNKTQQEFGAMYDCNQGQISKYERGEADIPERIKKGLFDLGFSMNWLITGTEPMLIAPLTIGDRLSQTRDTTKISVEAIAKVLGVDQETYQQFERSKLQPTDEQLRRFSDLTNRDFNWLKKGFKEESVVTQDAFRSLFPDVMKMLQENTQLKLQLSELEDILEVWDKLTYNQKSMVIVMARALAKENEAAGKTKK